MGTFSGDFLEADLSEKFDFVLAEGFLHSVSEKEHFVRKINENMDYGAFLIVSYYDQYSIFVDLLHSAIFQTIAKIEFGSNSLYEDIDRIVEFGEQIFGAKWHTKGHLRSLRTWILDVLLNPTMSSERTISTEWLIRLCSSLDIHLWSSWPIYRKTNGFEWHRDIKSTHA
ncbi:MAG: hypothetical protein EBU34_12310, partial [Alphaproteobacteria bacterium]|nr:hypothetical protein [Alphaproteobacteria bacterium]